MKKKQIISSSPAVLTIAGSDSCGGAGIQADLKTFAAFGVYGMSVITAVTAQNSCGVQDFCSLDPDNIGAQLKSVFEDIAVDAVKTGMLVDENIVAAVAEGLKSHLAKNLVVDPVIIAKDGSFLLSLEAVDSLVKFLIPLARLVTPNTYEAAVLAGMDKVETRQAMKDAALRIVDAGATAVLVKGGHLEGAQVYDLLWDNGRFYEFEGQRVGCGQPHGTGCTLSAAITAGIAKGKPLVDAIKSARNYTRAAIANAVQMGKGYSFLDHNVEGEWGE
jgi:hydroxymethylpyrimidine/phosphomethylpyrimidine kinase